MRHPNICIAGIDYELLQNLKSGACISRQQSLEVRPLLHNNQKWNINNHNYLKLYSLYEFEGTFHSEDNSKDDFYITSFNIEKDNLAINSLIDDHFKIAEKHMDCCDGHFRINELMYMISEKSFDPFSKPKATLGSYLGHVVNIYIKGNQWRGDLLPRPYLDDEYYIAEDLPITDIRFYDASNNFKAKSANDIKKQFSIDDFEFSDALVSIGLSREYRGRRWLQINTIHPEELFQNIKNLICPLCSSAVDDYTNNKPSYNFPDFRCSNKECNQGNGFPWSSWDPNQFN